MSALAVVHRAVRQLRRGAGRGPRQGPGRRAAQTHAATSPAKKLRRAATRRRVRAGARRRTLRKGDVVLVEAGDIIPGDGEVIEGVASVDESAITGESAPVIRESGGDRSARHRRHARALGLARRARHRQPGRDASSTA